MARLTLRIDFDAERRLGPGKIQLLELIDSLGSISAAGRAMEMSYRRAWLHVDALNRMFASPLVETRLGGRGGEKGANARLSLLGRAVVQIYRSIESDSHACVSARIAELEQRLAPRAPPRAEPPQDEPHQV